MACAVALLFPPWIRAEEPKAKVRGPGIDSLEVTKIVYIPFRFRLVAYDIDPVNPKNITVLFWPSVSRNKGGVVRVGDDFELAGMRLKLDGFQKKEVRNVDGTKADVSEATITNRKTGEKTVLPLGKMVLLNESYAVFRHAWAQPNVALTPDFSKRIGETFALPPDGKTAYKVISIRGREVILELPDGTRRTLTAGK